MPSRHAWLHRQAAAAGDAGDPNVPAGEVTWTAAAAPVPVPWPDDEAELLQLRPQMVASAAATAGHLAGKGLSVWWQVIRCYLQSGVPHIMLLLIIV